MNEPWFDPNTFGAWYGAVIGGGGGTLGGLLGATMGALAPRGKAKLFVLGAMICFIAFGAVTLAIGLYALVNGQPYGIWYPMTLSGAVFVVLFSVLLPVARMVYRQAEERRVSAANIRQA